MREQDWPSVCRLEQGILNHIKRPSLGVEAPITAFTGMQPYSPLLSSLPSDKSQPRSLDFIRAQKLSRIEALVIFMGRIHKDVGVVSTRERQDAIRAQNAKTHLREVNFDVGNSVLVARYRMTYTNSVSSGVAFRELQGLYRILFWRLRILLHQHMPFSMLTASRRMRTRSWMSVRHCWTRLPITILTTKQSWSYLTCVSMTRRRGMMFKFGGMDLITKIQHGNHLTTCSRLYPSCSTISSHNSTIKTFSRWLSANLRDVAFSREDFCTCETGTQVSTAVAG